MSLVTSNKLSHSQWECKFHIVWIPKWRKKVLYGKLRLEIGRILRKLCSYKGIEIVEAKACCDHIHMLLSIPPKYSVSEVVGYLKGKSAIMVFERFTKLRQNFRGHKFWARGYYVSTVGLDEGKIRGYIQDQEDNDKIEDPEKPESEGNPFEGDK
jgi:putative transposase